MWFFKRKKEKNNSKPEYLDETLSAQEELSMDQREVGHYVLDSCEQLIESARELDETKKEYDTVTNYLKDIELLMELNEEKLGPIQKIAEQIGTLDQTKNEYLNTSKKISDAQFLMMEQQEADIPDAIRRLQTNETYQATVKSDMSYLEGEKLQWTMCLSQLTHEKKLLRNASLLLFSAFVLVMVLLLVLQFGFSVDITWGWIITAICAVCGAAFIFIRYQNDSVGIVRAKQKANRAIELLNKTKLKYVNITNAVDYARETYHVKNAKEFEYQWEQYLEAVKEKKRYQRTNDELAFCKRKLHGLLLELGLYDASVWPEQSYALLSHSELSERKHNLLVRRQKLRARMQYNNDTMQNERARIDRLMELHPEHEEAIREMLRSVDKLTTRVI